MDLNPEALGWILGIGGAVLGLLGGLFGTYMGIRNTRGPRERAAAIRSSVATWLAVLFFLVIMYGLPKPWGIYAWIPFAALLPFGVRAANRAQQRAREEDARQPRGDTTGTG